VKALGVVYKGTLFPFPNTLRFIWTAPFSFGSVYLNFGYFRPRCQIVLFLEHFKFHCCCFWSSLEGLWVPFKPSFLLLVFSFEFLKSIGCFWREFGFCWSFLSFWTNFVLILKWFLPHDWRCHFGEASSVDLICFYTNKFNNQVFLLVLSLLALDVVGIIALTRFFCVFIFLVQFGMAKLWLREF